jgi:hypothetical protein
MRPYVIKLNHIDDITYEQEFSCSVVSCGFKNKIKIMPTINEKIEIGEILEVLKSLEPSSKGLFLYLMNLELPLLQAVFKELW